MQTTEQSSPSQSSTTRERPRYEQHAGLHVLRLSGDDYEMGFQHGEILRDAIRRGPLPYFERYVESMLGSSVGPRAGRVLAGALKRTVGRKIGRSFPGGTLRALDGLAEGSGMDRNVLLGAVTMPETYLWVLSRLLEWRGPRLAPRTGVPILGCTSAVAFGEATRDGTLLHGRNFDYQGVGAWDTEQAVVFHRPSDGQAFVSVSAAGVLLGGITAMNASGLSLVVHQHMASDALALGGVPIGVTGDEIMRYARNLDDARRILDRDVPSGCWTYIIASASEKAVLCYEITPRARAHRIVSDGTFGYANVFLDRELGRSERHLYPSHWRNNLARLRRSNQLLEAQRGRIDEHGITKILGDAGDGCRFEESISMLMTVASVVFRPADGVVWVATGRAPVSNRDYVAFDLGTEAPAPERPVLTGGKLDDARAMDAFDAYRRSYEAYFNDADLSRARRELEVATRLRPEEALYHYVAALLALLDVDAVHAELELDRALEIGHASEARVASFRLWRGRARDALGRRADAKDDYRMARRGDEYVRAAADRGLSRAWKHRRFGVEFTLADVPVP